jgi:hypothetical protein
MSGKISMKATKSGSIVPKSSGEVALARRKFVYPVRQNEMEAWADTLLANNQPHKQRGPSGGVTHPLSEWHVRCSFSSLVGRQMQGRKGKGEGKRQRSIAMLVGPLPQPLRLGRSDVEKGHGIPDRQTGQ